MVVSILWVIHIIIYVIAAGSSGFPSHPFLNDILTGLEKSGITFLSTAMFAFFSIYLLWCT